MCMNVDLPEPDGPMIARELAPRELGRDSAERVDGGVALAVAACHVLRDDDGPTVRSFRMLGGLVTTGCSDIVSLPRIARELRG